MLTALAATAAPWGYGPGPGFPLFFLVPLFWLVVLVLLGVVFGRRRRRLWAENGGPSFGPHRSPESTLSERFANGEIDEVEYRSRLEVLRANRPAPRR
jgi:putative membrane protein